MKINCNLLTGAVAAIVLFVSGCAGTSPPVSFYTLSADASMTRPGQAGTACSDKGIGVGPVSWPRYLDQPRIVTRKGPNTLEFDEFHRWGGSLQDDFKRILIQDLSVLLQTRKIADFRKTLQHVPDYSVELDVRQFDGLLGDAVVLDASWVIVVRETGKALDVQNSIITSQMSGSDYVALAATSSRAVAALARVIAAELLKKCSTTDR